MRFRCPICGTILYLSLNCRRKCYFHGEFRLNHSTGRLEPFKREEDSMEMTEEEALKKSRARIKKRDGNFGMPVVLGSSATELINEKLKMRKKLKRREK